MIREDSKNMTVALIICMYDRVDQKVLVESGTETRLGAQFQSALFQVCLLLHIA